MFKKALQVATAFGLLLAGYAGYVKGFAVVAARVGRPAGAMIPFVGSVSKTKKEAIDLAASTFGRDHWSTDEDLKIRYYNSERGYWMYAKEYDRPKQFDGKRLVFKPFALIWRSRDGKGLKTATSDTATIDLDQPLGLVNKPGTSMHVVHARIEGDVRLRDDKTTPDNPEDDLVIGPMAYVEYDEEKLEITSDSDIVIRDRDMRITGRDLLIKLRPKDEDAAPGSSFGFNGAKTAILRRNVHLILNDVGRSGILPGAAGPGQAQAGKTPLDLRCAGQMQVDLPKPRHQPKIGPPTPPSPTLAMFTRDVVVLRGKLDQSPPDQLNCDDLRLTLMPAEKAPPTATATAPEGTATADAPAVAGSPEGGPAASGPGTELTLRRAEATGHAVWLQSKSQGLTVRCNELIHKKLGPVQADETYFRGDATSKLLVTKLDIAPDGPDRGKVLSVTTIRTADATIFDDGQDQNNATVVARGPGVLETRAAPDQPLARKATWEDQLVLQTEEAADKHPQRKLTLTRNPKLIDLVQGTLDARKSIIVWLKPKPRPATAPAAPASGPASGSFEIEKLVARDDVHLVAPGRKMSARDWLDVDFELPAPSAPAPAAAAASRPEAAPTAIAAIPAAGPAGNPAVGPDGPAPTAVPPTPVRSDGPDMVVRADRVWAKIRMHPGTEPSGAPASKAGAGGSKSEIDKVFLRGAVAFHQDPEPDKQRGTDVTGDAVDVLNQGEGKSKFIVFHRDPTAPKLAPAKLAQIPPARVVTEEFDVVGPIIGLDQKADQAWVDGPGTLTQLAKRDLLTEKGPGDVPEDKAADGGEKSTTPMTITWKSKMRFFGQATDPEGQPAARAEFYSDVRAEMEDSLLLCQEMRTYLDRPVTLARPARAPDAPPAEPEPKAQIALIDCLRKVTAISRKVDPLSRLLAQQQQIQGEHVTYERLTGNFHVLGAGRVYLYNREGDGEAGAVPGADPAGAIGRRVDPMANPSPAAAKVQRAIAGVNAKARSRSIPPLKLTQVTFGREMRGRFVSGKDVDQTEPRWADFFGDVQALNARVGDDLKPFDFDRPPDDGMYLTSQTLRVISEPASEGSGAAQNFLKAWENAQARTKNETIQADVITYDSRKELFYAYGNDGREVIIAQQASNGQPSSVGQGQAVQYNRRSGESQIITPRTLQLVDNKTGNRPGPAPDAKPTKEKSTRATLRLPGRSITERKGFSGR